MEVQNQRNATHVNESSILTIVVSLGNGGSKEILLLPKDLAEKSSKELRCLVPPQ